MILSASTKLLQFTLPMYSRKASRIETHNLKLVKKNLNQKVDELHPNHKQLPSVGLNLEKHTSKLNPNPRTRQIALAHWYTAPSIVGKHRNYRIDWLTENEWMDLTAYTIFRNRHHEPSFPKPVLTSTIHCSVKPTAASIPVVMPWRVAAFCVWLTHIPPSLSLEGLGFGSLGYTGSKQWEIEMRNMNSRKEYCRWREFLHLGFPHPFFLTLAW